MSYCSETSEIYPKEPEGACVSDFNKFQAGRIYQTKTQFLHRLVTLLPKYSLQKVCNYTLFVIMISTKQSVVDISCM